MTGQLHLIDTASFAVQWDCENCLSAKESADWYEVDRATVRVSNSFGSWRMCDRCAETIQQATERGTVTPL